MLLVHKLHSRHIGRRRECRITRPWLEALERRDCPAVTAIFSDGILVVSGDEGNNVIDLFQPQDRVVEVVGDSQTWVFDGVDEVFVDVGAGDDQATSSKPKEIVVVGSKINLDMGAGNDTVRIDDGGPIEEEPDLLSTMNFSVNLGTGADELRVAAENSGTLNLSVQSADGFDRHELGHTLGLRHEHTRPESHVRMDLAGSGNLVDVNFDNIEQVDLSIVSEPRPGEPVVSHTIDVHFHVIQKGTGVPDRDDGVVILYSSLPGGDAERSSIGISPTSFSFSATAGGVDVPMSASAAITTGPEDDVLSIVSRGVDDLRLDLHTGAGDDLIGWDFANSANDTGAPSVASHQRGVDSWMTIDLGAGDDELSLLNPDLNSMQLFLMAGEGNDSAVIDGTSNTDFVGERPPSRMVLDLGGGNDHLALNTTDIPDLELDLTAGNGDDEVHTRNQVRTTALWGVRSSIHLGAGADSLQARIEGYGNADTFIDAGAGDDDVAIHGEAGPPYTFVLDPRSTGMVVDLGDGANQLSVETTGFVEVTQDFRGGEGNDQVAISDRRGPYFQFESKRLNQRIHTGGGNDIVLNDTQGNDEVESVINLESGDDAVLSRYRWAYLTGRAQLHVALSLGAGSDIALLETLGYHEIAAKIETGPAGDGRDVVWASFRLSPTDPVRRIRRVLDGRQDLFELFVAVAYDVRVSGDETTLYVLIGTPPAR